MDLHQEYSTQARNLVGWAYEELNWCTPERAGQAQRERKELLAQLGPKAAFDFNRNKLHCGPLSPGCHICGEGSWSCLFINGICNTDCFYCPRSRRDPHLPRAIHGLEFSKVENYLAYLGRLAFRGVGISGGEPFIAFDLLLEYVTRVRNHFGPSFYLWAYTNGKLANADNLLRLKTAGLDELRFDISAAGYNLDAVALATAIFPTVTVEIPAIPEDREILLKILPQLQRLGVRHLHLHQLYASRYNFRAFAERSYTLLHNPTGAVLESELAALKIMVQAQEQGLTLPINYCSVAYKHRLQARGNRWRVAPKLCRSFEQITANGFIRRLGFRGPNDRLRDVAAALSSGEVPAIRWRLGKSGQRLWIHPEALAGVDWDGLELQVVYYDPQFSYGNQPTPKTKKFQLADHFDVYMHRPLTWRTPPLTAALAADALCLIAGTARFQDLFLERFKSGNARPDVLQEMAQLSALQKYEEVEPGFSPYV